MYTDPTTTIGYRRVSTRREDRSRGTIGCAAPRSWPGLLRPCSKTVWISMRSKGLPSRPTQFPTFSWNTFGPSRPALRPGFGGPESCRAEGRLGSADASRKGQGRLTSIRLWKLSFASSGGGRRRERKCEGGTYRLRGGLWIAGQSEDDRRTNTERNDLRTHGCAARRDNDQGRPSRARQLSLLSAAAH